MLINNIFSNHGNEISTEEIEALVSRLGVILPVEYKRFIAYINGGNPKNHFFELRKFDPEETNINCYVIVDHFFHFEELEEIWNYTKGDLEELLLFPIAEVRGGMLLCCKQVSSESCELFFYDNNFGILKLTDSLGSFLNLLIPQSEVDYKKYGIDFTFPEDTET